MKLNLKLRWAIIFHKWWKVVYLVSIKILLLEQPTKWIKNSNKILTTFILCMYYLIIKEWRHILLINLAFKMGKLEQGYLLFGCLVRSSDDFKGGMKKIWKATYTVVICEKIDRNKLGWECHTRRYKLS